VLADEVINAKWHPASLRERRRTPPSARVRTFRVDAGVV
jgi:hypothetical protein